MKRFPLVIAAGLLLAAGAGFSRVQSTINAQKIVLTSPSGNNTITIEARDDRSGVWISSGGSLTDPMVAIYVDRDQGAAVGVWGDSEKKVIDTIDTGTELQIINRYGDRIHVYRTTQEGGVKVAR